ncbi:MAG TPA: HDOD domain-containing protein [Steroidobacteraceae bacterium]|nr:HDOD domain-containing protein [Steroidobacteraceae bacterium]
MTAATKAPPGNGKENQAAFEFVQFLAHELSGGKVELPSFPDVAIKVRKVLADDNVNLDVVVRIVGSEPALAARLLQIANSAALNSSGTAVHDLRKAVQRMGLNMVRSAAIAFAMSQMKKASELKGLEAPMATLWSRCTGVAAMSHVVARQLTKINPDTALLAGLLHGVGELYILTRANRHPGLFADRAAYETIVRDWHTSVAQALLENWEIAEDIVRAVSEFGDLERRHTGPADLSDVLTVAHLMVSYQDYPESIELNMQGVSACERMKLDVATYTRIIHESRDEIKGLQEALGA